MHERRAEGPPEVGTPTSGAGAMDRAVSWAPPVLLGLLLVAAAQRLTSPLADPDSFWHLADGRWVTQTRTFSGPDPFSTFADRPFHLNQWLLEVVYYGAWRTAGDTGLVVLQAAGPLVLLVALYSCTRSFAPGLVAATVSVVAWLGTSGGFGLRPQIVSFVLVAVVTRAWLRTSLDGRPRWWLVPLTWVWALVHGMWPVGVVVGGAALAGMLLDPVRRRGSWRHGVVLAASVVVTALTPVGPDLLLVPGGMTQYARFVTEWGPPQLLTVRSAATMLLLVVTVLVWARGRRRPSWAEVALWSVALGWALLYDRTVAVGAVISAVLAAHSLATALPLRDGLGRRAEAAVVAVGLSLGLVVSGVLATAVAARPSPYPTGLSDALDALPPGTAVLDDYALGGWLIWTHPQLDPYIDGRADVYTVEHFEDFLRLQEADPGWERIVARDRLEVALVSDGTPLAAALEGRVGWRTVATDRNFLLLAAPPD